MFSFFLSLVQMKVNQNYLEISLFLICFSSMKSVITNWHMQNSGIFGKLATDSGQHKVTRSTASASGRRYVCGCCVCRSVLQSI